MGAITFVIGIFHESPANRSKLPFLDTRSNPRATWRPNKGLGQINNLRNSVIVAALSELVVLPGDIKVEDPSRRQRAIVACHNIAVPEIQLAEGSGVRKTCNSFCQAPPGEFVGTCGIAEHRSFNRVL